MALVPQSQLSQPSFSSVLIIGPPFTGKTQSIATLHDVLVKRKLPSKMAFFDMDGGASGGGAETLLRFARQGNWTQDLELYRYSSRLADKLVAKVEPHRAQQPFLDFVQEFNALQDRIDPKTQTWQQGKELGAVIIDSATGLIAMLQDYMFDVRHIEIGAEGTNAVTFNHWRLLAEKFIEATQCARALPCYFVITAHVETKQQVIKGPKRDGSEDIATHQMYDVPLLPTNILRDGIAKNFSVVLYSLIQDNKFVWQTRPGERIRSAGTRGKQGLPQFVPQNFTEVLDM